MDSGSDLFFDLVPTLNAMSSCLPKKQEKKCKDIRAMISFVWIWPDLNTDSGKRNIYNSQNPKAKRQTVKGNTEISPLNWCKWCMIYGLME